MILVFDLRVYGGHKSIAGSQDMASISVAGKGPVLSLTLGWSWFAYGAVEWQLLTALGGGWDHEGGRTPCLSKKPAEDVTSCDTRHTELCVRLQSWELDRKERGGVSFWCIKTACWFAFILPSEPYNGVDIVNTAWDPKYCLFLPFTAKPYGTKFRSNRFLLSCAASPRAQGSRVNPSDWHPQSFKPKQPLSLCKFIISGICYSNRNLTNTNLNSKPDKDITRNENHKPIFLMDTDTKILNKIIPNWTQHIFLRDNTAWPSGSAPRNARLFYYFNINQLE